MITPEVLELAERIGKYFLVKNDGDLEATAEEIRKLQITDLRIVQQLVVTTRRPGLLIGARGAQLERLSIAVGMKVAIEEETQPAIEDAIIPKLENHDG